MKIILVSGAHLDRPVFGTEIVEEIMMKEFIDAIDRNKLYVLMLCLVCNTVVVAYTTVQLAGWVYDDRLPDFWLLGFAWVAGLNFLGLAIATCCINTADEVAGDARTKRAFHEMDTRIPD